MKTYDVTDLSTIFKVTPWTVWDWRKKQILPSGTRVSHKRRIWGHDELAECFPTLFKREELHDGE